MFLRALDQHAARYSLAMEIVIVEWNPPADACPLREMLPDSRIPLRLITVPPAVHARFDNPGRVPFLQWHAKNAGIRRSRGQFILATNVDLLFSDSLCRCLAEDPLLPDAMYRANRCDVGMEFPWAVDVQEQLKHAAAHVTQRHGRNPAHPARRASLLRRIAHRCRVGAGQDTRDLIASVDTDGCGDFTLLPRAVWERIMGYPELPLHAHIDALACHAAVATGAKQVVFPPECCVYHVDHEECWASMSLSQRIQQSIRRPSLDWNIYRDAVRLMYEVRAPLSISTAHWGCADIELPEALLQEAR